MGITSEAWANLDRDPLEAFELDAVDYLHKPVRLERLQAALGVVVRHAHRHDIEREVMREIAHGSTPPISGWWSMTWLLGRTYRLPFVPADRRNEPIEAAMPKAVVTMSGLTKRMVS